MDPILLDLVRKLRSIPLDKGRCSALSGRRCAREMQSRAHVRDPLPARPSLTIPRSADPFSRIRQIDRTRLSRHKRRPASIPSPIIANDRPIYALDLLRAGNFARSALRRSLTTNVAKNLGRDCISAEGKIGAKSFCPSR